MNQAFIEHVDSLSEQKVELCYHCHKCTAGCPVADEMEYGPDYLLQLIQFGEMESVLTSGDIWLCASCETCGTRCPNEINIAEVMDALRIMSVRGGYKNPETASPIFHSLFLSMVNLFGRLHEISLLMLLKFKTMNLLADMDSGMLMFIKGKVPIIPHRVKGIKEVQRIIKETEERRR
ncbi:MAG: 4Fe-4S dicluster domain-containing protein [Chloroflexota bacterium]